MSAPKRKRLSECECLEFVGGGMGGETEPHRPGADNGEVQVLFRERPLRRHRLVPAKHQFGLARIPHRFALSVMRQRQQRLPALSIVLFHTGGPQVTHA